MYRRILVVVERHSNAMVAIEEGVGLAARHGAELLFAHTLPRYVLPVADVGAESLTELEAFERQVRASADDVLATAAAAAARAGVVSVGESVSTPDVAAALVELAQQRRCELIVAASLGRNAVMRLVAGSVIPRLITLATVPVLVCRESTAQRRRSGLVTPDRPAG